MNHRDDSDEIANAIVDRLEGVLDELSPGWLPSKGRAYLTAKGPKQLGSFTVNLAGGHRGTWYRFSVKVGGGPMHLIAYLMTGVEQPGKEEYRRAFEWARQFLGMDRGRAETDAERAAREKRAADAKAQRDRAAAAQAKKDKALKKKRAASAAEYWAEGIPIIGTPAEGYLIGRRIPPVGEWPWRPDDVLRFHPEVDYELDPTAGLWPALIGRVQDAFGETVAIWQIFLDRDKPEKAPLDNPKVGRGPAGGGAVRIGGEGAYIGVAEGMESTISMWVVEGFRIPIWSTLSTSGMAGFEPPTFVKRLGIYPDGDRAKFQKNTDRIMAPPGISAAEKLAARCRLMNVPTVINETALYGDGNDFLEGWGQN